MGAAFIHHQVQPVPRGNLGVIGKDLRQQIRQGAFGVFARQPVARLGRGQRKGHVEPVRFDKIVPRRPRQPLFVRRRLGGAAALFQPGAQDVHPVLAPQIVPEISRHRIGIEMRMRRLPAGRARLGHPQRSLQDILLQPQPAGLGRHHPHQPRLGRGTEHLVPDIRDPARAQAVILHPRLVVAPAVDPALPGPAGLIELPVPDLVGELDISPLLVPEPIAHERRKPAHIVVIGQVRHAEPRIRPGAIGQFHHDLDRHALARIGIILGFRPVLPARLGRVVGAHPVHEAQNLEPLQPVEKQRVEHRAGLVCTDVFLLYHADVAHMVAGALAVGALDADFDRPWAGRKVEPDLVAPIADIARAPADFDDAVALECQAIAPGQRNRLFRQVGQDHRADRGQLGRDFQRPAVVVQISRRLEILMRGPAPLAGLVADPGPGRLEHVDERLLGRIVVHPRQVDRNRRVVLLRRMNGPAQQGQRHQYQRPDDHGPTPVIGSDRTTSHTICCINRAASSVGASAHVPSARRRRTGRPTGAR